MRAVDIIEKKRDGKILTEEEVKFFLKNYSEGKIPDYQMSAFLMAVYFRGMDDNELKYFTAEMINSGDTIDFPGTDKFLVDKHSTGGVGDKTTIALAPVLGALGMGTAKLSGKGLGHTGGTIDKFESIKGFKFCETREALIELVNKVGTGLMGASEKIVPLDKKLYALRDVTGTVSSIPLIASSIMSKKLAVHADAIILDVKVGSGAFMKTFEDAKKLAETMHKLGKLFNRNIVCMLSNMDEPLGNAVGNSLEVIEAIETLKGRGPKLFQDLIVKLGAQALKMKGDVSTVEEGIKIVEEVIASGKALDNLKSFIEASGGDPRICDDYSLLEVAKEVTPYLAKDDGYISEIAADEIGRAAMMLGAGRATKEDEIDHSVGIIMKAKVGSRVKKGDKILDFYHKGNLTESIVAVVDSAIRYSTEKVSEKPIILEIIGG
ncbi:MAG: thymidine phosphorylase [Fusobacteriaceae bacterium]